MAVIRELRARDPIEQQMRQAFLAKEDFGGRSPEEMRMNLAKLAAEQLPPGAAALDPKKCLERKLALHNARSDCLNQKVIRDRTYERLEMANAALMNVSAQDVYATMSGLVSQSAEGSAQELEQAFAELQEATTSDAASAQAMISRLNQAFSIAT